CGLGSDCSKTWGGAISMCGLDFDPDAPTPEEWGKFLKSLSPDDADSIDALREWFGYSLLPDMSQHKISMLSAAPALQSWPRLFHNLRASRETELVESYPVQVVTSWLGNTPSAAMRHYL